MWKVKQVALLVRKLFGSLMPAGLPCCVWELGVGALAHFSGEEYKHFLVKRRPGVKML